MKYNIRHYNNISLGEDSTTLLRLILHAKKIIRLRKYLYYYDRTTNGMSTGLKRNILQYINGLNNVENYYIQNNLNIDFSIIKYKIAYKELINIFIKKYHLFDLNDYYILYDYFNKDVDNIKHSKYFKSLNIKDKLIYYILKYNLKKRNQKIFSKKNINIIGTAGVPAQYGGFETLVENILNYNDKYNICVFCSSKIYKNKIRKYKNAYLSYINIKPNGFSSILYDILSMLKSIKSDYVIILGVSGCIFLPIFKIFYKGKIIINIDGIEYQREKWNIFIKKYLKISEYFSVKFANYIIADNNGIVNYINKKYRYIKSKVNLIEYGADHVKIEKLDIKKYDFIKKPYAITVCRIEPENNIHLIIGAFENIEKISLVIVGNWKNSKYGKILKNRNNNIKNIYLLDPIYNIDEISFLRSNALIYIHGHSAGGTNPSLVEAMYLQLPIFAFDCVYNRETTENKALYWQNKYELRKLLFNTDNYKLKQISFDMKEIANRRYIWKNISEKYFSLIK